MTLRDFISKQFIDVIHWTETEPGVLVYRFPMADMEIQNGAQLTVRESQVAAFVNEGIVADVFQPGLYTLATRTLPLLTNLKNWDKQFESPFKSDVYFFSTRLQVNQHWGTPTPITVRDQEFGAVRLRAHGIYSYSLTDARQFYIRVSGTTAVYRTSDLEGQLRNTIVGVVADMFGNSRISFLDMAANQGELSNRLTDSLKPIFSDLGLELHAMVVESLSLPDELQARLDERIGMNMLGDMKKYTEFQVAKSVPIAAANEGNSAAGLGVGLASGLVMGQTLVNAVNVHSTSPNEHNGPTSLLKFCIDCGSRIPKTAKFCPDCGKAQEQGG